MPHRSQHADGPRRSGSKGGTQQHRDNDVRNDDARKTGRTAFEEFASQAVTLSPIVKRHIFKDLSIIGKGALPGWVQLPESRGEGVALGLFLDSSRFCQVAFADWRGRVFVGSNPNMDTQDMTPVMMFNAESKVMLHNGRRTTRDGVHKPLRLIGSRKLSVQSMGMAARPVVQGAVVGRSPKRSIAWLASWLKVDGRYTLEQMRVDVPRELRVDLEYRDAVAVAFFATCMIPSIEGVFSGFGAGGIFHKLGNQAPIGAIRRSVKDCADAKKHGLRVSGLEEHFAELMHQAGALSLSNGLEAVHGAEPLHLYTSGYSGNYFFTWDDSLGLSPALEALRIEGNLNRFIAVSSWLEGNARIDRMPIEDTVTKDQAAQIDAALLNNPALTAFKDDERRAAHLDEPTTESMKRLIRIARGAGDDSDQGNDASHQGNDDPHMHNTNPGEWHYRQVLSKLLRELRVPFRADTEFRSNLAGGDVAVAYTTAGAGMMPLRQYDAASSSWVEISDKERTAMGVCYDLRVGLMVAALCFGASEKVERVSLRIETLGLEQAVADQDSAMAKFMTQALQAFEQLRDGSAGAARTKADPKDGGIHGDPSQMSAKGDGNADYGDTNESAHSDSDEAHGGGNGEHGSAGEAESGDEHRNVDEQFADLMKDVDFGESAFRFEAGAPGSRASSDNGGADGAFRAGVQSTADGEGSTSPSPASGVSGMDEADDDAETDVDSLVLERNANDGPDVQTLVGVTFERDAFMELVGKQGLNDPLGVYHAFGATMSIDEERGLKPVNVGFTLHDKCFAPPTSQSEPELDDAALGLPAASVLGAAAVSDLSIQRADVLQRVVDDFHRISRDQSTPSALKAQNAMDIMNDVGDPELLNLAPTVSSALIDGVDTPDLRFTIADSIDEQRERSRRLLFSGAVDDAIDGMEQIVASVDAWYAAIPGVPRYFNSYAERVIYNRMFVTSGECTVLIPDNLFYAHLELADVLAQVRGAKAALPHLNQMVAYAPAYPLSHMRLAVQLAREKDWNSARAACLNALRVSLDGDDAAYAYYRLAYAEWMNDRFDVAAACYIMSEHVSSSGIASLEDELGELMARAHSQCIDMPTSVDEAKEVLSLYDMPVWPSPDMSFIIKAAAEVCVDNGMFVPARTLAVAMARMSDAGEGGMDMAQAQFLRSLGA